MSIHRLPRPKLTYANVTATLALFIALGGTSYAALALPRNSVGSAQIRSRAVGPSELRSRAVTSRVIRDRSIRVSDMSARARTSLRGAAGATGPQGPPGSPAVSLRAAIPSGGTVAGGNATAALHTSGTNEYRVAFDRDVGACMYTASLAAVQSGSTVEQPTPGRITVAAEAGRVLVKTFAVDGSPTEQPFHLLVAC
jgi:hypothetical protein